MAARRLEVPGAVLLPMRTGARARAELSIAAIATGGAATGPIASIAAIATRGAATAPFTSIAAIALSLIHI